MESVWGGGDVVVSKNVERFTSNSHIDRETETETGSQVGRFAQTLKTHVSTGTGLEWGKQGKLLGLTPGAVRIAVMSELARYPPSCVGTPLQTIASSRFFMSCRPLRPMKERLDDSAVNALQVFEATRAETRADTGAVAASSGASTSATLPKRPGYLILVTV